MTMLNVYGASSCWTEQVEEASRGRRLWRRPLTRPWRFAREFRVVAATPAEALQQVRQFEDRKGERPDMAITCSQLLEFNVAEAAGIQQVSSPFRMCLERRLQLWGKPRDAGLPGFYGSSVIAVPEIPGRLDSLIQDLESCLENWGALLEGDWRKSPLIGFGSATSGLLLAGHAATMFQAIEDQMRSEWPEGTALAHELWRELEGRLSTDEAMVRAILDREFEEDVISQWRRNLETRGILDISWDLEYTLERRDETEFLLIGIETYLADQSCTERLAPLDREFRRFLDGDLWPRMQRGEVQLDSGARPWSKGAFREWRTDWLPERFWWRQMPVPDITYADLAREGKQIPEGWGPSRVPVDSVPWRAPWWWTILKETVTTWLRRRG